MNAELTLEGKIRELLYGIDRTESDVDEGWWETQSGADFGKQKLEALIALIGLEKGNRPNELAKEALMPTMEAMAHAWHERAQKCRDEAHDQIDWENPGTAANRLLIVAKTLNDCARELEIAVKSQSLTNEPEQTPSSVPKL